VPGLAARLQAGQEGIALILVVVCLAVLGLVAAGSMALALSEREGSAHLLYATQAEYAAEAGVVEIDSLRPIAEGLGLGEEALAGSRSLPGAARVIDTLRRLNDRLYLLRAAGERLSASGLTLGWHRMGRLLRRAQPAFTPLAALEASGVTGLGEAGVSGSDSVPPDWAGDCPPAGPPVPDIRIDSLAAPLPTTTLGDFSIGQLLAQADLRIGGTVSALEPPPGRPSQLIAAGNGTALTGSGRGRGLLVVDGDLEIAGGFEFRGVILVLGRARFTGLGGGVLGALVAREIDLGESPSVIRLSRCSVARALEGAARLQPLRERSWLQLP